MMAHRQSSKLSHAVPKYCPHGLFSVVILRLNQELISVKRKAEVPSHERCLKKKWLSMQPAWLRGTNSCSQLPSENWSFLYLSTGTEQPKLNYHSGKSYFLFFSYILINPMTRWWGLVPRLKVQPSEELVFPAHIFVSAITRESPVDMTSYISPNLTYTCIAFSSVEYLILIYCNGNRWLTLKYYDTTDW